MFDWWAVLVRRISVRALGDRAPTTRVRETGEGGPGDGVSVVDVADGERRRDGPRDEPGSGVRREYVTDGTGSGGSDDPSHDSRAGGLWIELEIEPLFPSSDAQPQHLVDLTEENESEPTP